MAFPAAPHGHAIADVAGLQAALDGKAPGSHSHALSSLSGVTGVSAIRRLSQADYDDLSPPDANTFYIIV